MANRDLLKEAIADAKAVKETAIANAKAALEEAFTPMLREKLAKKIEEMDEMDEGKEEMDEMKKKEVEENYEMDEANDKEGYEGQMGMKKLGTKEMDEAENMDEVDLDELLRELEAMDEDEMYETETMDEAKKKDEDKKDLKEEEEGLINDPKGPTAKGNVAEKEEVEASEEEEIDLENMSEDDLKSFIESVIADMVASGELEGNIEGEEGGEEIEGEEKSKEEVEITERKKYGGNKGDVPAAKRGDKKDTAEEEGVEDYKKKVKEMKKELDEAYSALETIKSELNEVNLFNAKLLYTNKIFKAKNLTESQKVKVLAAFDKAASVNEAKLVFETLSEGFKEKKAPVNESLLRGSASKPAGIAEKKPIMEVNDQFARWQKLAGIK